MDSHFSASFRIFIRFITNHSSINVNGSHTHKQIYIHTRTSGISVWLNWKPNQLSLVSRNFQCVLSCVGFSFCICSKLSYDLWQQMSMQPFESADLASHICVHDQMFKWFFCCLVFFFYFQSPIQLDISLHCIVIKLLQKENSCGCHPVLWYKLCVLSLWNRILALQLVRHWIVARLSHLRYIQFRSVQ